MENNKKTFAVSNRTRRNLALPACLLVQLSVGILYLWSIFNDSVQAHLSIGNPKLVGAFMLFAFALGNLIGGIIKDKTNPRLVAAIGCFIFCLGIFLTSLLTSKTGNLIFLTYSGMGGIGCGFVYGSILSCLIQWFPTRRGFASGMSIAAFGLSTVVFAPVSQFLLEKYGVVLTFRILGILFFAVCALSCVFITLPKKNQSENGTGAESVDGKSDGNIVDSEKNCGNDANSCVGGNSINGNESHRGGAPALVKSNSEILPGLTPREAVKLPAFWCIALTLFFANATWNILLSIIKPLGVTRGLSENAAGYVVMVAGIFNVLGRFGIASLSDKVRRELAVAAMAVLTLCCAVLLIFAGEYFYFMLVSFVAFAFGGTSAILPAMTVDICGPKRSGTNYGIAMLGLGFSSIIFATLSNILYENTGSYTLSFIMGAVTCLITVALMFLYGRFTRKPQTAFV